MSAARRTNSGRTTSTHAGVSADTGRPPGKLRADAGRGRANTGCSAHAGGAAQSGQATTPETLRARIDESSLRWAFSRSSGPGGQNVNKLNTRVALLFDLEACTALSDDERACIHSRCRRRISDDGVMQVVSSRYRSQSANREDALNKFYELLAEALKVVPPRRPTKTPRGAKRRRLEDKTRRSTVKELRRRPKRDAGE